jgi:hypothetical protein
MIIIIIDMEHFFKGKLTSASLISKRLASQSLYENAYDE